MRLAIAHTDKDISFHQDDVTHLTQLLASPPWQGQIPCCELNRRSKGVVRKATLGSACGVCIPNVHVNDSLGVNLRVGLDLVRLCPVALWEHDPTRLARFLLALLFWLHDDVIVSDEK